MQHVLQPEFIEGSTGRLLITCFVPPGGTDHWLLFVPPFAEEMNKSRRMISHFGRALAANGIGCCLPDPYGTGDSSGDFGAASLATWQQDLKHIAQWLEDRHGCRRLDLGGLRLGALQALQVSGNIPQLRRLILWQPIQKGQQQLTQFLRLRQAAAMLKAGPTEGLKELRQRLQDGEALEVAGYMLSPTLAGELDSADLLPEHVPENCQIFWLELSNREPPQLTPVSASAIEDWRSRGICVTAESFQGDSFWQTQEITEAPALIDASLRLLLAGTST